MNLPPSSAVKAELCRRSFYYFLQYFWDAIIDEAPVYNWHVQYLCLELEKIAFEVRDRKPKEYDLIINIPPGTTKSTICTIMFPVWCWTIDPSLKFITGSYSSDLSVSHAVKARDVIRSDKYINLFPELDLKSDKDNKTDYENNFKGSRVTTSVGGTATGKHAHIIIIDDPLNPKKAASDVERASANEWLDRTISTRKIDKQVTATILIMQRLHELDCTGHILSKAGKKIKHICLPGELSPYVKPIELRDRYVNGLLDVNRLSRDVLSELKADLGSYGYAGQIMQLPAPDEGGIIKKEWFDYVSYQEFLELFPNKILPTFDIFIDSAYTGKQENDPTALLACCYHNHNLYVKFSKQAWLEFPELIKEIKTYALDHNASRGKILIEPKASGKSIAQQLKRETSLNVIELDPPKDDKLTRVHSASPFIEARRVILIRDSWNDLLVGECSQFPNGQHDDMLDTLTNAISYYYINKKGRRAVSI